MSLTEQYIKDYGDGFSFTVSGHVSTRLFDLAIEMDLFEYNDAQSHREMAHVTVKKDTKSYECDFCDTHDYENAFYPVSLNGHPYLCFRKTLYGFTLLDAETLTEEYEYFPEAVLLGDESFIITKVMQLDELLLFAGCYWACPYACFVFDHQTKQFWNVSTACHIVDCDEIRLQDKKVRLLGKDKNGLPVETILSQKDLSLGIAKYGRSDM